MADAVSDCTSAARSLSTPLLAIVVVPPSSLTPPENVLLALLRVIACGPLLKVASPPTLSAPSCDRARLLPNTRLVPTLPSMNEMVLPLAFNDAPPPVCSASVLVSMVPPVCCSEPSLMRLVCVAWMFAPTARAPPPALATSVSATITPPMLSAIALLPVGTRASRLTCEACKVPVLTSTGPGPSGASSTASTM